MDTCPKCGKKVTLAALENKRNGKWTVLPLESAKKGDFIIIDEMHEAVNIMGEPVGSLPVAVFCSVVTQFNPYKTHPPSHYLEDH